MAKSSFQGILDLKEYLTTERSSEEANTRGNHNTPAFELKDEPYFKYFDYQPFVTPHSGLVQIRKMAEVCGLVEILRQFEEINALRQALLDELHRMLA